MFMLTNKLKFFANWDEKLLLCILLLTFFYVPIIEVQLLVTGKIFISNMHLKSLICFLSLEFYVYKKSPKGMSTFKALKNTKGTSIINSLCLQIQDTSYFL